LGKNAPFFNLSPHTVIAYLMDGAHGPGDEATGLIASSRCPPRVLAAPQHRKERAGSEGRPLEERDQATWRCKAFMTSFFLSAFKRNK
jgi:hypothetical protein